MQALTRLDDADLQAIAVQTLGSTLIDIDVTNIHAKADRDHDGDAAISIVVDMPSGSAIIPPRLLASARVALSRALRSRGDERLMYLSVDWPDDEIPPSPDVPT